MNAKHVHGELLSLSGPVTQERVVESGRMLLGRLAGLPERRAVFAVFVELAQNIMRHSMERGVDDGETGRSGAGSIRVLEDGEAFVVTAENRVGSDSAEAIRAQIGVLDGISREEISARMAERRRRPVVAGRAGLGLLDVARRADGRISVDFRSAGGDGLHMTIRAVIRKGAGNG